jgi:hypothetical protein
MRHVFMDTMLKQKLSHRNRCQKGHYDWKQQDKYGQILKVMLTVFFNSEDIVRHEFLPQGKTVTKDYYLEVMKRLREAIRKQKKKAQCSEVNPMDAPCWQCAHTHTSILICQFLAKHEMTAMPQPPYSPDLPSVDCFLFPKLKMLLKGWHFVLTDSIKENSLADLYSILNEAF